MTREQFIKEAKEGTTKLGYIGRLYVIAANGKVDAEAQVKMSAWEKYGKSRTYMKVNVYYNNGKYGWEEYGYYDNKSGRYVATNKYKDLDRPYMLNGMGEVDGEAIEKFADQAIENMIRDGVIA